ncbi:MAG TPA: helix-turn-helix transcriptional regulator [Streptosporangiaceae bacterium]|nr:helix-turn-helix transcriptional regulator [Streptosporangiaceae bacterium]
MAGNRVTARTTVGREIRRAREARGLSRAEVAAEFPVSESLVAKWEAGTQAIKPEYMRRLIEVLQISPEEVVRILGEVVAGEAVPEWSGRWPSIEGNAVEVYSFDLSAVPGLLQTPEYARTVLQYNRHAPIDIEEQVQVRLDRQKILDKDRPPTTVFVIDEYALRRRVGSAKIMAEQLMRLVEFAQRPDVFIHVVQSNVEYYAGCPFMIAKVDGTEYVSLDDARQGRVVDDPEEVSVISRIWQGIRSAALPMAASIERIQQAAQEWSGEIS